MSIKSTAFRRVVSDVKGASELADCGIFVHQDEEDLMKVHALIVGPVGT